MNYSVILYPVLIVGAIGLIFGCLLAFAAIVFEVKKDEREELIISELPGANCGACGYAGCSAYAAAVVELGSPKHKWLLHNALIAGSSSDRFEGSKSLRAKSGTSAEDTARIEIQDAGEYNVVEFLAGVYGEHVLGTQIRVEYTDANGNWVAHSDVITLN